VGRVSGPRRFYLLGSEAEKPLAFDDAQQEFQGHWRDARHAHVALMGKVGGHWVSSLHISRGKAGITRMTAKTVRNEAQEIADAALTLVASLDAALRVIDRAEKARRP